MMRTIVTALLLLSVSTSVSYGRSSDDAIRTVEDGGEAPGSGSGTFTLRAIEKVLPEDTSWLEDMSAELYEMAGLPTPI